MRNNTSQAHSRVRLEPAKRREQILQAALDAFHTQGYAQTSVRDLAQAVGISIAGMYHYFSTKDDILFAIIDTSVDRLLTNMKAACDSTDIPEMRLRAMLTATIRTVIENRAEIRILIDNADKLPPEQQAVIRAKRRESALMVRAELEKMRAMGRLRELDLNVITFAVNGMANWIYYWYHPEGPVGVEELANQFAMIFFHGILKAQT